MVVVTIFTNHPAATAARGTPVTVNPAVMTGSGDPTVRAVETCTDVACDIAGTVCGHIVTGVSDPAGTVVGDIAVPSACSPAVTVAGDIEITLAGEVIVTFAGDVTAVTACTDVTVTVAGDVVVTVDAAMIT